MGDTRSKLFGDDDNDSAIDLTDFKPTPPVRQDAQVAKAAAAKAGFKSREPKVVQLPATVTAPDPEPATRPTRRVWRTGRNVQINLKATPETVAAFYAIADAQGWVLGEALEKAVEVMQEKYGNKVG